MIDNIDYELFEVIKKDKKLTDIYIGYDEINWNFAVADYKATFTKAEEFTLFDKVICGLLKIEDHLSLEEIGEILGFNVIDDSNNKKYKDNAEYEILLDALKSLQAYEMIDGGDAFYSYCMLSDLGREYVAKGKKFTFLKNQVFKLYFDKVTNNHTSAKEDFEFLSKELDTNSDDGTIDYENEDYLKEFAEYQRPEIYNTKTLNSFKDVKNTMVRNFKVTLYRIYLLDIKTGSYSIIIMDKDKRIINSITEYIKLNPTFSNYNNYVSSHYQVNAYSNLDNCIEANLEECEKTRNLLYGEKNCKSKGVSCFSKTKYIEPLMFISDLAQFIEISNKEIWLILTDFSQYDLELILKTVKSTKEITFFLYVSKSQFTTKLACEASENYKNLYLYVTEEIEDFKVIFKDKKDKWNIYTKEICSIPITIDNNLKCLQKEFICKKEFSIENDARCLKKYVTNFANRYFSITKEILESYLYDTNSALERDILQDIDFILISSQVKNICFSNDFKTILGSIPFLKQLLRLKSILNNKVFDFQTVKKIEKSDIILIPFKQFDYLKKLFKDINKQKANILCSFNDIRKSIINRELNLLEEKFREIHSSNLSFWKLVNKELEFLNTLCFKEELVLFDNLRMAISSKVDLLEIEKNRHYVVVDTNALINEPNIIHLIGSNNTLVFSINVIDELNQLKTLKDRGVYAKLAIRNIQKHKDDKNVILESGDISSLPHGDNKNSVGNLILSVALKYKKYKHALLTNDKSMELKAQKLKIVTKNNKSILKYLGVNNKNSKNNK